MHGWMWCVQPLSITNAICFECGGSRREWRLAVRALRVVIRALAVEATRRSNGDASGHSGGRVGGAGARAARENEGEVPELARRRSCV
eukprot:5277531-Pleurochrysis_carterae.AAC.2